MQNAFRLSALAACTFAAAGSGLVAAGQPRAFVRMTQADAGTSQWISGELLVGFRAGVGPVERHALYRRQGADFLEDVGQKIRVARIHVAPGTEEAMRARLAAMPQVRFVEKNFQFQPALVPNDPEYPNQWYLPKINAPSAWDLSQGGAGALIAILDSGIDPSLAEFSGKLVAGTNTYDTATPNDTSDAFGHGTEVAGVAAAITNNGTGIAGMAGASPLMPVRVTNGTGGASAASIANGIVWAADHGARVINVSFDGVAGNATIRTAAEYAWNHGALVVAAAGNCGCTDSTPDNPFVVSVSATDAADAIGYYSSIGPFVDLAAPGDAIVTTEKGGIYLPESGTSLASPVVAGLASQMFAANAAMTPALVLQFMQATAIDLGSSGVDPSYGYGRVDAHAAVLAAVNYVAPADTTLPIVTLDSPADGSRVAGVVVIAASASDNVGVTKVDLYVDGAYFDSDASSPYSFAWDTSALAAGAHTLQVLAFDAAGNSSGTAPVTVTVDNATPHAPVAQDDAFGVTYRAAAPPVPQGLNVLANDSDADGDMVAASVHITQGPDQRGTASVNADGSISYTPRQGFRGTETLRYTVNDARGATSNAATVTLTVNGMSPRHGSDHGERNIRRLASRP